MKKKVIATFMTVMLVLGLAACGSQDGQKSDASSDTSGTDSTDSADNADSAKKSDEGASDTIEIQAILNTTATEYWSYVVAGAEAYGAEHDDVNVNVVGPASQSSYDEQMNMIETAVSSGTYDGLVISPLQAETTVTTITGAKIPIVAVNTDIEAPEVNTFVGTGNMAAAKEGGVAAVEAAKAAGWEEINAICLAGTQGNPTGEERLQGFKAGIEEAGGTFLADEIQYTDWDADKSVASMEAIMQTHPEGIAIIVSCADDMAMAAVRAAGGNSAFENTIYCGFDGNQAACESIIEGNMTMSVAQNPYEMGYQAIEACVKEIRGEKNEEFIDTGCKIITKENAQEQMDMLKSYIE